MSEDLTVKVADYAMFCEEYVGDYHVLADGSRLPLRWMAWESLLMVNIDTVTGIDWPLVIGQSIPISTEAQNNNTGFVVGSTITSQ